MWNWFESAAQGAATQLPVVGQCGTAVTAADTRQKRARAPRWAPGVTPSDDPAPIPLSETRWDALSPHVAYGYDEGATTSMWLGDMGVERVADSAGEWPLLDSGVIDPDSQFTLVPVTINRLSGSPLGSAKRLSPGGGLCLSRYGC